MMRYSKSWQTQVPIYSIQKHFDLDGELDSK